MHLLTAQAGSIDDGKDPIDLAQSAGDIVVLTSADTEIAGLAKAQNNLGPDAPSLRLANLLNLNHNYSVDLYIEQTLCHAKLIIIRVLGGPSYWSYGLDEVCRLARGNHIHLAVISGSAYKDETLDNYSTLPVETTDQLWSYLTEGGPENYQKFLSHCQHIITPETTPQPHPATPLPKAGLYWPGSKSNSLEQLQQNWQPEYPVAAITFYRALLQSADLAPIDLLIKELMDEGLNPLPIFASSLKDQTATEIISAIFKEAKPAAIINTTSFAISNPGQHWHGTILDQPGAPVFQAILSGSNQQSWQDNPRGLIARDIAMNVTLPELDGRITTRAISFKSDFGRDENVETNLIGHKPEPTRTSFVAKLASNWVRLKNTPIRSRKVALILSNYPSTDGRIANGVGLDTPASTIQLMQKMADAGYQISQIPETGDSLIQSLQHETADKTNWQHFSLSDYKAAWQNLPSVLQDEISARWGKPEQDPSFDPKQQSFQIRAMKYGHLIIGVQPGRGSGLDAKQSHHDATIPPTHEYLAFYFWLRFQFNMDAIIHMGKHGNLEWLPGKALALSEACAPEAILGPTPHIYPFIVNDPGEGAQAKRRTSAVIVDHLTPPLTRSETYGPLKDLEALVDEYYEAAGVDPRRTKLLGEDIINLAAAIGLSKDCDIDESDCEDTKLQKLDNFLCELKELQIRDGLHIFGKMPDQSQKTNLLLALTRLPRNEAKPEQRPSSVNLADHNQSLMRTIANDLDLNFDPLITEMANPWQGLKPAALNNILNTSWRTHGDTVERIELLAESLINGTAQPENNWPQTSAVLNYITNELTPLIESCAEKEINGVITALDGQFLRPGPSGAPTRGRIDVLPTGRNFYTIDNRTIPTQTAWRLGQQSAERVIKAYTQSNGEWPKQIALSAWGTSNMRTGGDDIAQALAFIGVRPSWDAASRRVTGFEIIPLSELGRPRTDLLLRISGFFRDAFPAQIDLLQSAMNAVAELNENEKSNPLRANYLKRKSDLQQQGIDEKHAESQAKARIFGSAQMQYGAGIKDAIHNGQWTNRDELASQYINSSAYTYGLASERQEDGIQQDGIQALDHFKALLKATSLVVQNQDSREFDILDSEDFYQFEGGLAAAVENQSGTAPEIYHNDHSNPENPKVQTLKEEIAKIVRGRAANPKWIKSIQRHGTKGASEILATVTNLSAFASLTNAVEQHHFESLFEAYLVDEEVRNFLQSTNKPAMDEITKQFTMAIERGLWQPKRNSAYQYLSYLQQDTENEQNS